MNDSWGFHTPPEQQAVVDAQYKKANKLASRRPLPSGIQVTHSSRNFRMSDGTTGPTQHTVRATEVDSDGLIKRDVGEVTWAGDDGHVAWMGAPPHIVPHLLAKAHEVSSKTGDAPPLYAEDLSPSSHRLMRKYLPSQVPKDVTVSGLPLLTPENFAAATEVVNHAHAAAHAALPPELHGTINRAASDARAALTEGRRSHSAMHRLGGSAGSEDEYFRYQEHASTFHANSHAIVNAVQKHGSHVPGEIHALRSIADFMF